MIDSHLFKSEISISKSNNLTKILVSSVQLPKTDCTENGCSLCSDPPTDNPALTVWPEGKKVRYLITLKIPNRGFPAMTAKYYDWEDSNNQHPGQELMY